MADLLAAALEYAAAGVHVFPARVSVHDGYKTVAPVGRWRNASTTDPTTIRSWFAPGRPWAEASLCIDCGKSELVVVDLDEGDGKQGVVTWATLVAEFDLPVTAARARTPSGGEHWYYRENHRRVVGIDSSGKVAHGVDVRGLGGFVIAWPSEDSRGAYGQIDLEALAEAPVIPDLVADRMQTREAAPIPAADEPQAVSTPSAQDEFWSEWAIKPHTREQAKAFCQPPLDTFRALRTPEDSGFNDRLNSLACIWSHFIPAFMTTERAEAEIYAAAVANRSVEWQGEHAVRATIRSGLAQRSDPWKAVRVETAEGGGGDVAELDREVARLHLRADAQERFAAERHARTWAAPADYGSLNQELLLPDEDTRWRLDGLLGVGHNAVLVAGRKVGKTTIVNNLIRSYVDGDPFLGRFAVTPSDAAVAVFNYEVDERQYRRWVREVGIINPDRVFVLHLRGRSLPLRDAQVRRWTANWLRERGVGLWIVDPYSRAYVGSLDNGNDEAQVGAFLDTLDVIKHEAGVGELVMPVHTPKARVETGDESAIGSQRLEGWPDSMWYLTKDYKSGQRFLRAEGRDVSVEQGQLNYIPDNRSLELGIWSQADLQRSTQVQAVVDYVTRNQGCSQNDLAGHLGIGADTIRPVIDAVRTAGVAIRIVPGKNRTKQHYVDM